MVVAGKPGMGHLLSYRRSPFRTSIKELLTQHTRLCLKTPVAAVTAPRGWMQGRPTETTSCRSSRRPDDADDPAPPPPEGRADKRRIAASLVVDSPLRGSSPSRSLRCLLLGPPRLTRVFKQSLVRKRPAVL